MDSPASHWLRKYWGKDAANDANAQAVTEAAWNGSEAVRKALQNIGIRIKVGKIKEFERQRLPELIALIQADTSAQISRATQQSNTLSRGVSQARSIEGSDQERVREAIDEAVELGIMREEIFPSDSPHSRDVYILSGAHYGNSDFDPTTTPQHCKGSQAQFFQFAHLLQIREAQSPIFVEGRTYKMKYNEPIRQYWNQKGIDLNDTRVQERLFKYPEELVQLMDEHQRVSGKTTISTPVFYSYASFNHIAGAHSPATEILLQEFFRIWMPWYFAFNEKYKVLTEQWKGVAGVKIEYQLPTGWDGPRPCLEIGGNWVYADDVQKDCENLFRYAQELKKIDDAREADVSDLMQNTHPKLTPMAFMGLGHSLRVEKSIRSWATTHILTPMAAVKLDHQRSYASADDVKSSLLNLSSYQSLHHAACNVPPLLKTEG